MKKLVVCFLSIGLAVSVLTGCSLFYTRMPKTNINDMPPKDIISSDSAIALALEEVGLTESDAIIEDIDLELENGIWVYDIEFRQDSTEYKAEVHAGDGTILTMKKENIFD